MRDLYPCRERSRHLCMASQVTQAPTVFRLYLCISAREYTHKYGYERKSRWNQGRNGQVDIALIAWMSCVCCLLWLAFLRATMRAPCSINFVLTAMNKKITNRDLVERANWETSSRWILVYGCHIRHKNTWGQGILHMLLQETSTVDPVGSQSYRQKIAPV